MSLMNYLTEELNASLFETKSGLRDIKPSEIKKDFDLDKIKALIEPPGGAQVERQNLKFSMVRKTGKADWPFRTEEVLERCIVASNLSNVYNQFNVGGGKVSVDLIIGKPVTEFIELKPWRIKNNPFYATLELLKNFFLFTRIPESPVPSLRVLAPSSYYKSYEAYQVNLRENLTAIKEHLFATNGVIINYSEIELIEGEFLHIIADKCKPDNWRHQKTTKYDEIAENCSAPAIDKLEIKNWKSYV